jgi:hypothetical protein
MCCAVIQSGGFSSFLKVTSGVGAGAEETVAVADEVVVVGGAGLSHARSASNSTLHLIVASPHGAVRAS